MPKYYNHVSGKATIQTSCGQSAVIPIEFTKDSSRIISRCSFLQSQIQRIIFSTHGSEVLEASMVAKDKSSPNARMDFLCLTPYGVDDEILSKVFSYSQTIFRDVYQLRNVLAHEIWMSCDDYRFKVLFSKIEEEARILKTSGRLRCDLQSTSREVYDAVVRYISKIKIIDCEDLKGAIRDIDLCEWMLMTLNHILVEEDLKKKEELKMAFLKFSGTSFLFTEDRASLPGIDIRTSRTNVIDR